MALIYLFESLLLPTRGRARELFHLPHFCRGIFLGLAFYSGAEVLIIFFCSLHFPCALKRRVDGRPESMACVSWDTGESNSPPRLWGYPCWWGELCSWGNPTSSSQKCWSYPSATLRWWSFKECSQSPGFQHGQPGTAFCLNKWNLSPWHWHAASCCFKQAAEQSSPLSSKANPGSSDISVN